MLDKFDITINVYLSSNEDANSINLKLDEIMATIQELTQQVDDLQVALDAEQAQITQAIADLNQTITDLQALVTGGGTEAERQALADKLTAIKADLEGTVAS